MGVEVKKKKKSIHRTLNKSISCNEYIYTGARDGERKISWCICFCLLTYFELKAISKQFYSSEQCFYRIEKRNKTIIANGALWDTVTTHTTNYNCNIGFLCATLENNRNALYGWWVRCEFYALIRTSRHTDFDNFVKILWIWECQCFHFDASPCFLQLRILLV